MDYRNYNRGYAEPTMSASDYMTRTYRWMASGLLITFAMAYITATTPLLYLVDSLYLVLTIAELALVFVLSSRVQTMSVQGARATFFGYALLNGMVLSYYFLAFSVGTLILAFLSTALYFGLMAVYGTTTHKDLTGWGPRLMMALVAMLIGKWTGLAVDGYVGLVVALFILFSAYKAAKETLSPLLGQAPDPELVREIRDIVLSDDTVVGVHDLVVHDYGPGRLMITLHAEVPAHGDIMAMHDVIDNIEKELMEKLHCHAVIHMDPVDTDDASIARLREQVAELVKQVEPSLTIHDFRVVRGTTHDNLIFDAVLPFSSTMTPAQAAQAIRDRVRAMDGNYYAVVTVEHSYTD